MITSKKLSLSDTWKANSLFTAIFLIGTWKIISKQIRVAYDGFDYFYPLLSYAIQSLRNGTIPLWDPYSNAGVPNHLEPQNYLLNPLTYIFSFTHLHTLDAFNIFWLLFWWLGGIGVILLLRHSGSTLGRVVAACAFTFSGFQIGHAQHTSYVYSASFLPWLFYFSELFWEKRSFRYSFLTAATAMLSAFGGYPVLLASNCVLLAAWMLYRAPRKDWGRIITHLSIIAFAIAIAMLPSLASIAIEGPFFFKREGGGRLSLAEALISNAGFTPASFLTILSPIISALGGPNVLHTDWAIGNGYAGFLVLPFALFWLQARLKESKPILPYIGAFLFFLILSTIHSNGFLKTFYYYAFFPVQFMLYGGGFRIYWIFLLVLATGLGMAEYEKETNRKRIIQIFAVSTLIFGAIMFSTVLYMAKFNSELSSHHWFNKKVIGILFEFGIFILASYALLARKGILSLRRSYTALPIVLFIILAIDARSQVLNSGNVTLARDFKASELALDPTQRYTRYLRKSYSRHVGELSALPGQAHLNGHLIQREYLLGAYTNMLNGPFARLMESRFSDVLLNGENFYWISPSTKQVTNDRTAILDLYTKTMQDPLPVYVEQSRPQLAEKASVKFGSYGRVQILSYQTNSVHLHVEVPTSSPEAILASTERYSPSWRVSIDQGPFFPVIKSNFLFRGAYLTAGEHDIVFKYEPRYYLPLASLAWLCMFILVVLGLRRETRLKR